MMDAYQEFIFKSRYARWLDDVGRREDWPETVSRYVDFFEHYYPKQVKPIKQELEDAIRNLEVMPSMRCLMTADRVPGEGALSQHQVSGYNCCYTPIDNLRVFDEALYILMCGTGLGFSVERQYIRNLPEVAGSFHESNVVITVADSKIGWAKALKETIALVFSGTLPKYDFSRIRPAGSVLKTMGGRASGPEPLEKMLRSVTAVIKGAAGRRLSSLECHDMMCHIAGAVVVGGVRRAALISLSNLSDERMAKAKSGQWWELDPQRALANNSIAFSEKPDVGTWMREWNTIYESKSGERGVFNRQAAIDLAPDRRDTNWEFGCNPCSEILLRGNRIREDGSIVFGTGGQFCNLTEVIVRPNDKGPTLARRIRLAAIMGSLQATLVDFKYLSASFARNTSEEALLGVSLSGIYDNPWLLNASPSQLETLRDVAVDTNKEWAKKLGINQAAAVTCIKPSGTVSQLCDSASGIHPRYGKGLYFRRVRNDKKDPISQALIDAGVPHVTDPYNPEAWSFTFIRKAPEGAVCGDDVNAIQHLNIWKKFALHWCEHKPSVTISVAEKEWPEVGAWMWENFHIASGLSFLPKEDESHTYTEAPYERCTEADAAAYPKVSAINWDSIDESINKETELACSAGACDI